MFRTVGWCIASAVSTTSVTLGLCSLYRHGQRGSPSHVEAYVIQPAWYICAGVSFCVTAVDQSVRGLLLLNSVVGGGSFSMSTEGDYDLREFLRAQRAAKRTIIVVANHNTFLDAPLLATRLGRAAADRPFGFLPAAFSPVTEFLWTLDAHCWPFSVASASLLFYEGVARATFISLLCGLPVQPKWASHGEPVDREIFELNNTQYLPDIIQLCSGDFGSRSGAVDYDHSSELGTSPPRALLIFPEGRLLQDAVEHRDEEGRWTQLDGRKSEPGARVGPFMSGVGRILAHCSGGAATAAAARSGGAEEAGGPIVLPVAHVGLDALLPCRDDSYKLKASMLCPGAGAAIRVRFGRPRDFSKDVEAFEAKYPHLSPLRLERRHSAAVSLSSIDGASSSTTSTTTTTTTATAANAAFPADFMCEEKRQLYRDITDQIRHDVIRLHAEALEESKAADAAGKKS